MEITKVQFPVDKEKDISLQNKIFDFLNKTHSDYAYGTCTYQYKDDLKMGLETKLDYVS